MYALAKSSRMTSTWSLPKRSLLAIPLMVVSSYVTQDRILRKACCLTVKMLFWSQCRLMIYIQEVLTEMGTVSLISEQTDGFCTAVYARWVNE